jgi:hypothetical protein
MWAFMWALAYGARSGRPRTRDQKLTNEPPRTADGTRQPELTVLPVCYHRFVAVRKKRSISLPPDLDDQIAAAAEQAGMTYSAWLAATARKEFTLRAGLAAVTAWERDHGAFTPDELADADAWADQATGAASSTPERKTA